MRVLPAKAWQRYQLRFRSEIIAPASLTTLSAIDRQYAGVQAGADAAYVVDSNYLPNSGPLKFKEFRPRARAGMIYEARKFDAFYGVSWAGKVFET
ncbi:MAG: hypothetical protein QM492_09825 [Rhodobacterales bacterium]